MTIYCWIVTLLFYVLDQECCKIPGGLTNDNIGRCKEAICGEGLVCGYDGFDDIKLALCGTDYIGKVLNELKQACMAYKSRLNMKAEVYCLKIKLYAQSNL